MAPLKMENKSISLIILDSKKSKKTGKHELFILDRIHYLFIHVKIWNGDNVEEIQVILKAKHLEEPVKTQKNIRFDT